MIQNTIITECKYDTKSYRKKKYIYIYIYSLYIMINIFFFFGTGGSVSKYQNKFIINAYVYCMKVLYSLPILMLVYILTETK